ACPDACFPVPPTINTNANTHHNPSLLRISHSSPLAREQLLGKRFGTQDVRNVYGCYQWDRTSSQLLAGEQQNCVRNCRRSQRVCQEKLFSTAEEIRPKRQESAILSHRAEWRGRVRRNFAPGRVRIDRSCLDGRRPGLFADTFPARRWDGRCATVCDGSSGLPEKGE